MLVVSYPMSVASARVNMERDKCGVWPGGVVVDLRVTDAGTGLCDNSPVFPFPPPPPNRTIGAKLYFTLFESEA